MFFWLKHAYHQYAFTSDFWDFSTLVETCWPHKYPSAKKFRKLRLWKLIKRDSEIQLRIELIAYRVHVIIFHQVRTHTKLLHARTNLTLPFGLFMLNRRLLGCGYCPRFRIRDLLLRLGTAPGTKISISEPRSLQSWYHHRGLWNRTDFQTFPRPVLGYIDGDFCN